MTDKMNLRLSAGDETRIMIETDDGSWLLLCDIECGGMTSRTVVEAERIAAQIVDLSRAALRSHPAGEWTNGARLIAEERQRQIQVEGRSFNDDQAYEAGELVSAAVAYALEATFDGPRAKGTWFSKFWPWDREWFKPKDKVRDLQRAGALIAAEIDRLLALPSPPAQGNK